MHILYVDDDEVFRELASTCLARGNGFTVSTAASGREALTMLDSGLKPDVIMLDVMMPDLDGPGTLAMIRQGASQRDTPVIFLTAQSEREETDRLKALNVAGILTKPFNPARLAQDVDRLLRRAS